ncbi:MAG: FAD-dependent oxidoreductase [Desulfobacterales bacterium]|jgi:NADPH-dependent glutamate synthase beta subunit-like oxidoreductase
MSNKKKFAERFNDIEMFRYCEQCGRCSSACPITGINDFNIRRLIRHVELDLIIDIAESTMPWFCAVCGRCEDACPNGIKILDITRTLRSIGPEKQIPAKPQCVEACPAGIDVPGYLRYIAQDKPAEACKLIIEKAPFPGVLGRVCTHPCETACKRGEVGESISICAAKRYAADKAGNFSDWMAGTAAETGHKIAVIGAGPAGLSAAFYLRKKGHQVTIFEGREKPGGMMRYGIPYYRLPGNVLDKEIEAVLSTGIELRTGQKLGVDYEIDQLKQDGYKAVFVAVGAQLSRKIDLEGSSLDNVLWGVEFLSDVAEGGDVAVKERVVVIGGGNVAVDVALTALRLGAKNVKLACLESREEMPANPWEIEQAQAEGVEMLYSWGPDKIIENDGKVAGIELVRCTSVFDDEGNFCPYFDDTKKSLGTDQLILAVGQTSETAFCRDFCFLDDQISLPVNDGLIAIDKSTQQTEMQGVYAGGDAANGPATVIEAIAAGRRAAISIDIYLGGDGTIELGMSNVECGNGQPDYDGKREAGFAELKRVEVPSLPLSERHTGFSEVELCYSDKQVKTEIHRCLQCDLEICLAKEKRAAELGN